MKIIKTIGVISLSLFLMATAFTSCKHGSNSSGSDSTETEESAESEEETSESEEESESEESTVQADVAGNTTKFQAQITAAATGSFITLDSSKSGGSISISKAITIDGNGVEDLEITIDPSIASNVVLRNFKNAKVAVKTVEARFARSADEEAENEALAEESSESSTFKQYGEDCIPIYLEGCTLEEFSAEDDIALYLGTGSERTTIDSLNIKEGVEDFTFIEFDEDCTSDDDKSYIKSFYVEDEVDQINLIGGSFGEVDFGDGFTDSIDFYYDAEYEQFTDDSFMEESYIDQKDISLAENEIASGSSGVYSYTISKEAYDYFNGAVTIAFLNNDHMDALAGSVFTTVDGGRGYEAEFDDSAIFSAATVDSPIYTMALTGPFTAVDNASGLNTLYGSESYYYTLINYQYYGFVIPSYLDSYKNYNKEAVIVDVGSDSVTYYIDTASIKKSDLVIASYGGEDGQEKLSGTGSKLSEISLEGYTPYFVVDESKLFNNGKENIEDYNAVYDKVVNYGLDEDWNAFFYLPVDDSSTVVFEYGCPAYYACSMESSVSYPDVSAISYAEVAVSDVDYVNVYYFDKDGNCSSTAEKVILGNINPTWDSYYYFHDKDCTNAVTVNYETSAVEGLEAGSSIYAKAKEEIYFYSIPFNEDAGEVVLGEPALLTPVQMPISLMEFKELLEIDLSEVDTTFASNPNAIGYQLEYNYNYYSSYDEIELKGSEEIEDFSKLTDGDNVFCLPSYVKRVITDGTNTEDYGYYIIMKKTAGMEDYEYPYETNDWYKDKACSSAYTAAELALCTGETAYIKSNYKVMSDEETVEETISYFELKERIESGEEYYPFYSYGCEALDIDDFDYKTSEYTSLLLPDGSEKIVYSSIPTEL